MILTSHPRSIRQSSDQLLDLLVLGRVAAAVEVGAAEDVGLVVERDGVRSALGRLRRERGRLPILLERTKLIQFRSDPLKLTEVTFKSKEGMR